MFNFEKLEVWRKSIEFADLVYNLTRSFPVEERFSKGRTADGKQTSPAEWDKLAARTRFKGRGSAVAVSWATQPLQGL
jgi:23S rRNA-intervening sequence protein